jgi:hypothetical protein
MDSDWGFDEVVLFEMPSEDKAERLWLRLQSARTAWVHRRDDTYFVAAALRPESADLARLLREVEAWLVDTGVPRVQFELDGRRYSLSERRASVAGATE